MKVVILCGGQGTRLREETEFRPKPMVEVGGRPILWHIMKKYAHHGFQDFVLCLGYRGDMIKDYFLNYEAMNSDCTVSLGSPRQVIYHNTHGENGFRVTLAETGRDTMTGGRLKRIAKYIDDDTFLATYGDGLSDVSIPEVIECHRKQNRVATVTAVRPVSRFGILDVATDGAVTQFSEKPLLGGWMNAGFFVLNRKVFDYIDGDDCIFEHGPLENLAAEGQLTAFRHDGFFFAMDTYREYKHLNELWAGGKAPWKVWP